MKNKYRWLSLLVVISLVVMVPMLTGVSKGKTLVFKETKAMPPVTFDGGVHADAGLKCNDCHTKVFPMKQGATPKEDFTMSAMREGKACGTCHNGTKAFTVAGNCTKCHKK